jgi:hypothetical protein
MTARRVRERGLARAPARGLAMKIGAVAFMRA